MPNYSKRKIYTIRNKTDETLVYVGSTRQSLAVRMGGHRNDSKCKRRKACMFYSTVSGDWKNWFIDLYEDFPCERLEQLKKREGEVQREIATLNVRIEDRTKREH